MFTTKVDKKTLGETNALLISGTSLKETSELTGLPYHQVQYIRSKLVKAGVLQPLHRTHRAKRLRKNSVRTEKTQTSLFTNNTPTQDNNGIQLVINGINLNIRNVKSVDVAAGFVDIKY